MKFSRVYLVDVLSCRCRVGCVEQQASPPTVMAPALAWPDVYYASWLVYVYTDAALFGLRECELPSSSVTD